MAQLEDTDLLLVQRSDQTHKMTGADLKASVEGVTQIIAGTNVTLEPTDGKGVVKINADGGSSGGGGSVDSVNDVGPDVDGNVELTPADIGASKPGDNITDFSNNAGYVTASSIPPPPVKQLIAGDGIALSPSNGLGEVTITNTKPASGGGGGSVESVNKKTPDADGNVQLDATDVGALKSGDPITSLNNNAGYITSASAPVSRLYAGTGITLSPSNGLGGVTITNSMPSTGGGLTGSQKQLAKGWVTSNGSGTQLLSYGVTGITNEGLGRWNIQWQSANNSNHCFVITSSGATSASGAASGQVNIVYLGQSTPPSANKVNFKVTVQIDFVGTPSGASTNGVRAVAFS